MLPQLARKTIADNPKQLANLIDLVNLPSTLREFVGQSQISRLGCFMHVWSYIKTNNLQDPNNKNLVNCDEKLRGILLGKPQIELAELPMLIKLHFPKVPNSIDPVDFKRLPLNWRSSNKSNRMATSILRALRLRKEKSKRLCIPSTSKTANPDMDNMERRRFDSLESWSMILDSENVETWEVPNEDKEEWTADLSQLFIGNKFASGAHSRIYRGIYKQRAVAVKMVRIPNQDEETRELLEKQFKSEVALLSRLLHPNIVQFIAACKKPPVYCIITEYMSQGTLRMYLNKKQPYSLSIETVLRLALDISHGMQYLHSQGVIHRDLKSNNLLLNDEMRVKVADFGTSCLETQCQASKGNMGTYRWMAPEMIKEKPYTKKVDVYSFGIVLWELTTALLPFQGMTPVQAAFAVAEKNERPPLPANCQPALASLIKRCWASNPSKRPDFNYIVSVLESYDECVNDGLPLPSHSGLPSSNAILERFKVCISLSSSIPVPA